MEAEKKTIAGRKFKKSGIAPLVEVDPLELTDKRLNPEEAVIRERQELLKMASKSKISGQEELEDAERACGPRLNWTEVLRRLQKCNPQIQVKDGMPGSVALYLRKKSWEFTESDQLGDQRPKDPFFIDHKYVGGFPKHEMPEYSFVDIDTSHLPTREHRGWRSVLIALIKTGAITYESAIKEFGDPTGDSRSGRWFDQVGKFKKR